MTFLIERTSQLLENRLPFLLILPSQGTPNLIIGHHLLVGKVVELDKPFAVMKKKHKPSKNEEIGMDIENDKTMDSDEIAYEVVAFVKRKLIFKNRPRPIITKVVPINR